MIWCIFCFLGNGTIEFKEFVDLLAPTLKDQAKNQEELREAFKVFDKNGKTVHDNALSS